jgi:hypothetical protein
VGVEYGVGLAVAAECAKEDMRDEVDVRSGMSAEVEDLYCLKRIRYLDALGCTNMCICTSTMHRRHTLRLRHHPVPLM